MFTSREDAGRRLAEALRPLAPEHPVILGLPRGGVPLAAAVARELHAPVDVLVVRKLGAPWNPEFGFGAVGEGGVEVVDLDLARRMGVDEVTLARIRRAELAEVDRRTRQYRGDRPGVDVAGRTVVIVDDGIATGVTMRAAVELVRARNPHRLVVAAPVGSRQAQDAFEQVADDVVLLEAPAEFRAVGMHYQDFSQVSDEEVAAALASVPPPAGTGETGASEHAVGEAGVSEHVGAATGQAGPVDLEVVIPVGSVMLPGRLQVPEDASGLVVFAHGSGSSRFSTRNVAVANRLREAGVGTLLFDLLTEREAEDRANVFDIALLAERILGAAQWATAQPSCQRIGPDGATEHLPVGVFGASTGGGAALVAAAAAPGLISTVISRGGRPDLAGRALGAVRAPTLLIVGGRDLQVLDLNRQAMAQMTCEVRLDVVPGATHVFSEPGTLEQVADLAAEWFAKQFV